MVENTGSDVGIQCALSNPLPLCVSMYAVPVAHLSFAPSVNVVVAKYRAPDLSMFDKTSEMSCSGQYHAVKSFFGKNISDFFAQSLW